MTLPEGGPLSWHEMMWRSEQLETKRNRERILILETALRQSHRLIENALLQATLVGVEDTEDDEPEPDETKFFYCRTEWSDEQTVIPAIPNRHDLGHNGKPHRCVHPAGHEREEPHYCRCGAEL